MGKTMNSVVADNDAPLVLNQTLQLNNKLDNLAALFDKANTTHGVGRKIMKVADFIGRF